MLKRCRSSPRSLYLAAKQGNVLQVLVSAAGCNVNATIPQEKHKTAMHAAAAAGHLQVLRLLHLVSVVYRTHNKQYHSQNSGSLLIEIQRKKMQRDVDIVG